MEEESFYPTPCVQQGDKPHTQQRGSNNLQSSSLGSTSPSKTDSSSLNLLSVSLLSQKEQQQHDTSCISALSSFQSKVKTLSQHRIIERATPICSLDAMIPPVSFALALPALNSWASCKCDEDSAPQESTFKPDASLLAVPRSIGEGSSLENLSGFSSSTSVSQLQNSAVSSNAWVTPKSSWKAVRPKILLLNGNVNSSSNSFNTEAHGTLYRTFRSEVALRRELQPPDSHTRTFGCFEDVCEVQGFWRANSPESVGSNFSSLSLTERVEMNRGILKQMLNSTQQNEAISRPSMETSEGKAQWNNQGFMALLVSDLSPEFPTTDSEESQRPFLSEQEQWLSPCHEQAERLLKRARMKARTCPLKADHTILSLQRETPEPATQCGAAALQRVSGNLSDSSSGDSAYEPRRRLGQSPTRVRFEDETEREAEVRYLERLKHRRRAGERYPGLLLSKSHLSKYMKESMEREPKGVQCGAQTEPGCHGNSSPPWHHRTRKTHSNMVYDGGGGSQYKTLFLEGQVPNPNDPLNYSSSSIINPYPSQVIPVNGGSEAKMAVPVWGSPREASLTLHTERIRETYIGLPSPCLEVDGLAVHEALAAEETDCNNRTGARGPGHRVPTMKVKRGRPTTEVPNGQMGSKPPDRSHPKLILSQTCSKNCPIVLPPNPYTSEKPPDHKMSGTFMEEVPSYPPLFLKSLLKSGPNSQQVVKATSSPKHCLVNQDRGIDNQDRGAVYSPHIQLCVGGELKKNAPSVEPTGCGNEDLYSYTSTSVGNMGSIGDLASEASDPRICLGGATLPPGQTTKCLGRNGCARGPMRAEPRSNTSPSPDQGTDTEVHEGRSKLSFRRIFTAMGLNSVGKLGKRRSSSMEHLRFPGQDVPLASSGLPMAPAPDVISESSSQLRRAPSLQSLRMSPPFFQLRKTSSAQSLQFSKKKGNRSCAYSVGEQQSSLFISGGPQRGLSVEDVGFPTEMRSMGRVAQAFPDGTLLLEITRPPSGPFGFFISRGKGRQDSGVYVEEMRDSSTEKLYAGLLAVGDEILEVNGEKVAGLSLNLVTHLMTRDSTASVRVLRHRRLTPL